MLKGVQPEETSDIDWQDLDELAKSTIMLTLSKSVLQRQGGKEQF